jgi:hypothetical protein
MSRKRPGSFCRLRRFMPGRGALACRAPIQKPKQRQSLDAHARLGTALA